MWHLTAQDIQEHISLLEEGSSVVHPVIETPVVLSDPNDDPVIYAAVAGKANVLCTLDQHFFDPDVARFAKGYGIQIVTDVELLSRLRP